ncbi:MAG: hypothetical protein AB9835_03760 [Eubacteriales bacterium]
MSTVLLYLILLFYSEVIKYPKAKPQRSAEMSAPAGISALLNVTPLHRRAGKGPGDGELRVFIIIKKKIN